MDPKNLLRRFSHMTEREASIVALVAEGLCNGDIGARLGITERTVKNTLTSVPLKMGVEAGGSARVRIALAAHGVGPYAGK